MGNLAKTAPNPAPKVCPLGRILASPDLDDDDRAALAAVLDPASGISASAATAWIRSNGFPLGHGTTSSHLAGTCVCGKD